MRAIRGVMAALAVCLGLSAHAARADEVEASYSAWIGTADLYNSNGQRLTESWQVLRQDRANFHRFGIRQPGDEWDPLFSGIDNRAAMERMIMGGGIDPAAAAAVVRGNVMVHVTVWITRSGGRWIEVRAGN